MKRFLLAVAAVVALTVGSSFTSSAMADGGGQRGHRGHHGHAHHRHVHQAHHHHHHHRGGYYGGGYGGRYNNYRPSYYRPSYGYGGYSRGRDYGYTDRCYYDDYGRGNGGVIQIQGPRGGFSFAF